MDTIALLLKLAHIVLAMLLVGGLVGRWIVLHRAEESRELPQTLSLLDTSAPFERMTIVSSMLILPVGLATAWAQGYDWLGLTTGWMVASVVLYLAVLALVPTIFVPRSRRFDAALEQARGTGTVTTELSAAFADPGVRLAHWAEVIGIGLVVGLMVLKPF